ncbi:MAG: hypothetical protein MUF48_10675 [Pirellulaceae bacterium]|jgi:hypothetical protein|nr:hypothetical protein [Pirellulaceae bacterium]
MNRFTWELTVWMLLGIVGVNAQEQQNPPANYEHLKSYEALIGTWVYQGDIANSDEDDDESDGTEMTIRSSWKWIVNKTAVEVDWQFAFEDRPPFTGKSIIQWDPVQRGVNVTFFGSHGGTQRGPVDIDPQHNTWTHNLAGVGESGQAVSARAVFRLINPDQLSYQAKDRQGGPWTGDGLEMIFHRVKPTNSAAAHFEYWQPLIGNWKSRWCVDGAVVEGTYLYEPSATAHCFTSVSTLAGQPDRRDIHGYDPERDCWLVTGFTSDGGRETSCLRIANMDEIPQLASGAKGTYESVKIAPDGTASRSEGRWTWVAFDSPRFVLELKEVVTDGEPQPDAEITMERSSCDGAQASREDAESLIEEYIRVFSGRFVCDFVADEDIEGYVSKGESVRVEMTQTPFPDRTGMSHAWHLEKDGVIRGRSHGISIWNPSQQVFKSYASATGGFHVEDWKMKRDGAWHCRTVITFPDGRRSSSSSAVEVSDDGQTHTTVVSDRLTHTGQTLAPVTNVWRRISKNREVLEEHVEWLIGDWTGKVDLPGMGETTVDYSFRWIARGEVIQVEMKGAEWEGLSIIFYDPADGAIKMWGAHSAGGNGQAVMQPSGNSLAWTNTAFSSDGKKSVRDFIFEKRDDGNQLCVIVFGGEGGEQWEVTLHRK